MIDRLEWTEKSLQRNRLTDSYEPLQPFLLHEAAERLSTQVVLDVGANIGFYTVLLGKLASVDEIHAFEPIAGPFKELRENVRLNHLMEKCLLYQVALSDTSGQGEMTIIGECSGANALAVTSIHEEKQAIDHAVVPLKTMDEIVEAADKTLVMKLDVEGHEFEVLQGANRLLTSNRGIIQVEIYDRNLRGREIAEFLNSKGWHRFFSAGPDHYFSNVSELLDPENVIDLLEAATAKMIQNRLTPPPKSPIRRKIAPGVFAELSPRLSRMLRMALKRG